MDYQIGEPVMFDGCLHYVHGAHHQPENNRYRYSLHPFVEDHDDHTIRHRVDVTLLLDAPEIQPQTHLAPGDMVVDRAGFEFEVLAVYGSWLTLCVANETNVYVAPSADFVRS